MTFLPSLMAFPYGEVSTVGGYGPYQTGSGGEFTLSIVTGTGEQGALITTGTGLGSTWSFYAPVARDQYGSGQPNIQTFCVEGAEHIYPDTAYDVTTGTYTRYTGTELTVGAAWLYFEFATGQLSYNYGAGRTTSADQLQRTIWALMGQEGQTLANTATDPYTIMVLSEFGSSDPTLDTGAFAPNGSQYPVSVLRLWAHGDVGNEYAPNAMQDQLILTADPPVPDGGMTVALLGMALTGLGVVSRKIRK